MKNIKLYFTILFLMTLFVNTALTQNYEMVEVPGAKMKLGATDEQLPFSYPKEFPAHEVELPNFLIGKYEVSQQQWINLMGDNPSLFKGADQNYPVEYVDWMSAIVFCNEATLADPVVANDQLVYYKDAAFSIPYGIADYDGNGNTEAEPVFIDYSKNGYRLPTEAEWEFAARGGLSDVVTIYAGNNDLEQVGVYAKNSDWYPVPRGTKFPNQIGVFDMSGNVWEHCNDWYGAYPTISTVNPKGPDTGTHRVLRGGAYDFADRMCRVASRYMAMPDDKDSDIGFRLARNKS